MLVLADIAAGAVGFGGGVVGEEGGACVVSGADGEGGTGMGRSHEAFTRPPEGGGGGFCGRRMRGGGSWLRDGREEEMRMER